MARIRTIKPEFPQSESMGRVSRDARLLFVELWTICDDSGRTRAHSRMLASLLFPYDDDVPDLIDGWLAELEREDCIIRYQVDGQNYLQVCKWLSHQKIDKPSQSKIPEFDEGSRILSNPRERSSEDQGSRTKDQGPRIKEGKGGETPADSSASPTDPPVIGIVLNDGSDFPITSAQADEFAVLYPAVDVMQTLRAMRAWSIANPTKRKTKTGVMRFVNGWLAKEQDNPKSTMRGRTSNQSLRELSA